MSGPKIFFLLLVLIAVLFVVALGWGLHSGSPKFDLNNFNENAFPLTKSMSQLLGSRLKITDVKANCPLMGRSFKIAPSFTCTATISPVRSPFRQLKVRKVKLTLVGPGRVHGTYVHTEASEEREHHFDPFDLEPGQNTQSGSLVALSGGGTLSLRCNNPVGSAPCRVDFQ